MKTKMDTKIEMNRVGIGHPVKPDHFSLPFPFVRGYRTLL